MFRLRIPSKTFFAALVSMVLLASSGCTTSRTSWIAFAEPEVESHAFAEAVPTTPRGPGAVFASPEAAASDALAWSYLASRASSTDLRRARGGAIREVAGGFSYDEPTVERRKGWIHYPMQSTDVAHFIHFPERWMAPRGFRSIDEEAVHLVEDADPEERPFFYMAPDGRLATYDGSGGEVRTLGRLELETRDGESTLALREVAPGADPVLTLGASAR